MYGKGAKRHKWLPKCEPIYCFFGEFIAIYDEAVNLARCAYPLTQVGELNAHYVTFALMPCPRYYKSSVRARSKSKSVVFSQNESEKQLGLHMHI